MRRVNTDSRDVVIVIPCRLESTRLPGKVLLARTGKFLLQHTYEKALESRTAGEVVIATDNERIRAAAEGFGARVVMTSRECSTGTERTAEAAAAIDGEIFVNLQADEPEMPAEVIDETVEKLLDDTRAHVYTVCSPIRSHEEWQNPSVVKCITNAHGHAVYFSRAAIPFHRDGSPQTSALLKHHGIYVFRRQTLLEFPRLQRPYMERAESLEQLRLLWHGYTIGVNVVEWCPSGIDTPEEYEEFVERSRREGHSE